MAHTVDGRIITHHVATQKAIADKTVSLVEKAYTKRRSSETNEMLARRFAKITKMGAEHAANAAVDVYMEIRELEDRENEYEARAFNPIHEDWLAQEYKRILDKAEDEDSALTQLKLTVEGKTKWGYRETIIRNTELDPKKPWYARVPRGTHTCAFCIILASRGAVYNTEETAGKYETFHPYCDCAVVPMFHGQKIKGYDPDLYYEQYRAAREAVGPKTKSSNMLAATAREMRRREGAWALHGKPAPVKKPKDLVFNKEQKKAYMFLASQGIALDIKETNKFVNHTHHWTLDKLESKDFENLKDILDKSDEKRLVLMVDKPTKELQKQADEYFKGRNVTQEELLFIDPNTGYIKRFYKQ